MENRHRAREEEEKVKAREKNGGSLETRQRGEAGGGPHSHVDSHVLRPVRWQAVRAASVSHARATTHINSTYSLCLALIVIIGLDGVYRVGWF